LAVVDDEDREDQEEETDAEGDGAADAAAGALGEDEFGVLASMEAMLETGMDEDQLGAVGGGRDVKAVASFKKNAVAIRDSISRRVPTAEIASEAGKAWDQVMGLFKILFGFLQIVSTLSINLPTVEWPVSLTGLWDAVGVVANIDLMGGLSVDCIDTSWNFYNTFHANIIYPLVLLLLVLLVTRLRLGGTNDESEQENIKVQGIKLLLFGSFVIYPSVSATILKIWHCRQIEDSSWVVADYRVCAARAPMGSTQNGSRMLWWPRWPSLCTP